MTIGAQGDKKADFSKASLDKHRELSFTLPHVLKNYSRRTFMKRILVFAVVVVVSVMLVSSAFAAAKGSTGKAHKNVGCGLGTMLWQGKADNLRLVSGVPGAT